MSASDKLPNGAKQGMNDFKRVGYGGPCPPPGKPHRYYFKLYALDTVLELKPGQLRRICCAPWKVILLPKLSLWEFTAGDSPPFD
jgi:Raf kinase inhibitor-like YbhB/YbcL family protein